MQIERRCLYFWAGVFYRDLPVLIRVLAFHESLEGRINIDEISPVRDGAFI